MRDKKLASGPAVLLDLDDTILDFHMAEKIAVAHTLRELGVEPTDEVVGRYSAINLQCWKLLEEGLLTREQVLVGRFEKLFGELESPASPKEAKSLYEERLALGHFFMPGAQEMLSALQSGYRLFICSNGTASVQAGRIASAGIAPLFERIFISEEIGFNKPDREYFAACFRQIPDFDPERAIMIGDSLSSDIRGGINAGIKTLWYNPQGREPDKKIKADYETDNLLRVAPMLDGIF